MHHPSPSTIERCITCGSTEEVVSFLEKHPDVMYAQDEDGNAILSRVARTSNIQLISWLLKKGVDLLAANKYGQTALHRAFVVRDGAVSALLYYYEKQIPGNPMEAKNDSEYTNIFLALPDVRIRDLNEAWHKEQVETFKKTMHDLSSRHVRLPEATHRIAMEHIDRLNREARSLSDSSGGSGASSGGSAGSELHHRRGGGASGGGGADEEKTPLLVETAFKAAAAGEGALSDKEYRI